MSSILPDIPTFEELGGTKNNYDQPVDASTDYDAWVLNQVFANAVAATHTVGNLWCRYSYDGYVFTIVDWDATWIIRTPTAPVFARTGTGTQTMTLPPTVQDENLNAVAYDPTYNPTHTVNLRRFSVAIEGSTAYRVQAAITAPNVLTIYTFNNGGTLTDLTGVTISVEVK